jgi:hypothetical protein
VEPPQYAAMRKTVIILNKYGIDAVGFESVGVVGLAKPATFVLPQLVLDKYDSG